MNGGGGLPGPDRELGRAHLVAIGRSLVLIALVAALLVIAHLRDWPWREEAGEGFLNGAMTAPNSLGHFGEAVGADRRLFVVSPTPH